MENNNSSENQEKKKSNVNLKMTVVQYNNMIERQNVFFRKVLDKCIGLGWKCLEDNYENCKTKMRFICVNGHQIEKTWNEIGGKGATCYFCTGKGTIYAKDVFLKLVKEKGFTLLDEYINTDTKVTLLCPEEHYYLTTPNNFKRYFVCSYCNGTNGYKAESSFRQLIKDDNYQCQDEYLGRNIKIKVICPENHEYMVSPHHFINGVRCSYCSGHSVEWGRDNFEQTLDRIGYVSLEPYVSTIVKVWVQCNMGHKWHAIPNGITSGGQRCSECRLPDVSNGESLVLEYLREKNIQFYWQHVIDQLPTRKFDFYIISEGDYYLLEFDGRQHFEMYSMFHKSYEDFLEHQEIDRQKTWIPQQYGYKIIRIDHNRIGKISYHIDEALRLKQSLYLSNVDMYQYLFPEEKKKSKPKLIFIK